MSDANPQLPTSSLEPRISPFKADTGMDHFLRIARRGVPGTGASGGEVRARQLALAILEFAPGLDEEALSGAAEFLLRAPLAPSAARFLIGGGE